MTENNSDIRHKKVLEMAPPGWDMGPMGLATEIKNFLKSAKDEGTSVDSGTGDGDADLWVTVQGVEYYINIRRSNNQLVKDGVLPPPDLSGSSKPTPEA